MWKCSFPHCTLHFLKRVTGKHFPPASLYLMLCFQKGTGWGRQCWAHVKAHYSHEASNNNTDRQQYHTSCSLHTSPCIPEQRQFKTNKQLVWTVGKGSSRSWNSMKSYISKDKQWSKWLLPFLTTYFCSPPLQALLTQTQVPNTQTALTRTLVHISSHESSHLECNNLRQMGTEKEQIFKADTHVNYSRQCSHIPNLFHSRQEATSTWKRFFKKSNPIIYHDNHNEILSKEVV